MEVQASSNSVIVDTAGVATPMQPPVQDLETQPGFLLQNVFGRSGGRSRGQVVIGALYTEFQLLTLCTELEVLSQPSTGRALIHQNLHLQAVAGSRGACRRL